MLPRISGSLSTRRHRSPRRPPAATEPCSLALRRTRPTHRRCDKPPAFSDDILLASFDCFAASTFAAKALSPFRRGFRFHLLTFGPPSPTSGFGLRRSCELSYARVSQSGFYSAYVRRMRCEIYLTTQVDDTSLATCIRQSMYTAFLRARRSCPQEACAWE